jgi:hypothetical protein
MLLLFAPLVLIVGCAQQVGSLSSSGDAASARQLPFDRAPDNTRPPATADLAHPEIPAGTAIVIRLQSPISSAHAHAGEPFEGVLDGPVLLTNQTVLASSTVVHGTVLAAKAREPREPGYLRLTLSSILLDNKTLDIHTSSLFAKGSLPRAEKPGAENRSRLILENLTSPPTVEDPSHAQGDVKFSTARRLTFHLLKAVPLPN